MKYVVDKDWLMENLLDPNTRIVDCRFSLADKNWGEEEYRKNHLPGSVYFDLEKDLSGTVGANGGRHPLPMLEELIRKLELAGINENTVVVAYDQGDGQYAARFWWLLQYLGHEKVFVLNEGIKGWKTANYPITTDLPLYKTVKFNSKLKSDWVATMAEVKSLVRNRPDNIVLIDSREANRYLGFEEPIDKKAGHIPGAVNKPWMEGLEEGRYKTVEEQNKRFSDLSSDNEVIVYCGSGVTAVPNFLALKESGFEQVKLYVGSFSDWISDEENEIE